MILPKAKDAVHKAWLYRLLMALLDNSQISQNIYFKGGTCASMLNFLDRFSIDLDFDLKKDSSKALLRPKLEEVFRKLGLKVKDKSKKALQYFLKYPSPPKERNTIKLDIIDQEIKSSQYSSQYLNEIDRYAICQTIETMFAHKLVAITDRFKKNKSIAARDLYDIDYYFLQGFAYDSKVIEERTGEKTKEYLQTLVNFIRNKVTQKIIDQDLNTLLNKDKFKQVRKSLKKEVLILLEDEIKRIN